MFGEALVLVNDSFKERFRFNMKQKGAILAKGWFLGVQFEELFKNNLYIAAGAHSIAMMKPIKKLLKKPVFLFYAKHLQTRFFLFSRMLLQRKSTKNI